MFGKIREYFKELNCTVHHISLMTSSLQKRTSYMENRYVSDIESIKAQLEIMRLDLRWIQDAIECIPSQSHPEKVQSPKKAVKTRIKPIVDKLPPKPIV